MTQIAHQMALLRLTNAPLQKPQDVAGTGSTQRILANYAYTEQKCQSRAVDQAQDRAGLQGSIRKVQAMFWGFIMAQKCYGVLYYIQQCHKPILVYCGVIRSVCPCHTRSASVVATGR